MDTSDARAVLDANTLYDQGGLANGDCPARDLGDAGTAEQTDVLPGADELPQRRVAPTRGERRLRLHRAWPGGVRRCDQHTVR
ncbi:MAG: hypothetical protein WKF76_07995 [Nocardioidaceae bacterium]